MRSVAILVVFVALAAVGCTKERTVIQQVAGPAATAPPVVTAVVPAAGPVTGGTAVTLSGSAFVSGATVTIGGAAATSIVFASGTQLTAVAPAGAIGSATVLVTNPDGQAG